MYTVVLSESAQEDGGSLPLQIARRVALIVERLERWPEVSGVKALAGKLRGKYRIRTGDWRVLFSVDPAAKIVTVWKISNRKDVYED